MGVSVLLVGLKALFFGVVVGPAFLVGITGLSRAVAYAKHCGWQLLSHAVQMTAFTAYLGITTIAFSWALTTGPIPVVPRMLMLGLPAVAAALLFRFIDRSFQPTASAPSPIKSAAPPTPGPPAHPSATRSDANVSNSSAASPDLPNAPIPARKITMRCVVCRGIDFTPGGTVANAVIIVADDSQLSPAEAGYFVADAVFFYCPWDAPSSRGDRRWRDGQ